MPRTGLTPEEIKQKAIACAIVRMRRQGFDKVRLSDIARDLGVSHAALYSHFIDKSALLDSVSERWLNELDAELETYCQSTSQRPLERLQAWFQHLHQAKRNKVLNDIELYKAFNFSVEVSKPFVFSHLMTSKRQVSELVKQAMAEEQLSCKDPETVASLLLESTIGFHHPRLVLERINQDREPFLLDVLALLFQSLKS
jgi:AcrR family transcriptional regulator